MPRPDALDERLLSAIDRLGDALRTSRQELATRRGLTLLQVRIVEALSAAGSSGLRVGSVAADVGVSSPTVSDAVASLVRKGLAQKASDPGDGRATLLSLTETGGDVAHGIERELAPIRATAAAWDVAGRDAALSLMMESIAALYRAGVIIIDRSCVTCLHYRPGGDGGLTRCRLLELDLRPADLRVRCPEHAAAVTASQAASP